MRGWRAGDVEGYEAYCSNWNECCGTSSLFIVQASRVEHLQMRRRLPDSSTVLLCTSACGCLLFSGTASFAWATTTPVDSKSGDGEDLQQISGRLRAAWTMTRRLQWLAWRTYALLEGTTHFGTLSILRTLSHSQQFLAVPVLLHASGIPTPPPPTSLVALGTRTVPFCWF